MKIWDVSIRQPVFMTMVLIAGIVMGVYSYFRMPVDVYPNVEFPVAVVMAVFLPVAYAEGIIGRFFVAFGLTVAIAMGISFFESLTMAPMLSAYLIGTPKPNKKAAKQAKHAVEYEEGEAMTWLDRFYRGVLRVVLRHKWVTVLLTIAIFAGSIYGATFLTFSFIPTIDQHQFTMQVTLPAGTPLAESQAEALRIENILRRHPAVTDLFTTVGSTGAPEKLSFFAKLDEGTNSRAVIDEVRAAFAQAPGLTFSQGAGLTGAASEVTVEVRGLNNSSYDALGAQAAQVMDEIKTVLGLVDFTTSFTEGRPEIRFVVDRSKAAELGLSTAQIGSTIRTLVNGQVVTTYRGDGDEADIRVLLDDRDEGSVDAILDLSLLTPTGKLIPLRQVATPEQATGPGQIVRVDKQPTVRINANVAGRPVPVAVAEVTAMVEQMQLPDGMIVKMGGTTDAQNEGFRFIMLMGLVTKNSILLVDFANRERQKGLSAEEAMLRAGPIRLRPILMTSLSMILAMIPLVLGFSTGGEFRQGMSIAIMGGLVTSTLLTLLIVPVAYAMVVGGQERWSARRAARKARQAAAEPMDAAPPVEGSIISASD